MTSLEDKLTGEVVTGYVSDSDEDGHDSAHSDNESNLGKLSKDVPEEINDLPDFNPKAAKTGPKGVLEDYKRYKELEHLENIESTKEKIALHKKLAFTADPNKHPEKIENTEDDDFEDDEFLKKYHAKRLAQMQRELEKNVTVNAKKFQKVFELNGTELLDTIEKEDCSVIVVVHLYENHVSACKQMNSCLDVLAKQYSYVKFCKVRATNAGLSLKFKLNALPTIQIYKAGLLIGNFMKIQDMLDKEFYASDVENFLLDSDILTSGMNFSDLSVDSD